jgi:hypothetical protein
MAAKPCIRNDGGLDISHCAVFQTAMIPENYEALVFLFFFSSHPLSYWHTLAIVYICVPVNNMRTGEKGSAKAPL